MTFKSVKIEIFKADERKVLLLEDLVYKDVVVPQGFICDLASIPRFFWRVISPFDDEVLRAGIVHDYLYRTGLKTRNEADEYFYNLLIEDGLGKFEAYGAWAMIRLFGEKYYRVAQ